ncbi:Gfo/Idh/MocA family protein [Pseudocolwellia agarivorans]|uniref:Gfo/Idh/MocA family protein n=1 Tax=Pseudocolwellia agarivorans TaxID=1911682 RepID=UPI000986BBED|nr:Gfo/Idh/MocA family oxidoreductase [Pseudocolwellia agarivorans]
MRQIKWGLIGCGNIAHQFAQSLGKINSGTLCAVASNTPNKAESFAKKYKVDKFYTNYDDLVNDKNIDAVYIATPHNFHYENAKLCIAHNKHVLCEKPITINAKQLLELMSLAEAKSLFLMEAVWTRFLPAIEKLQSLITEGIIGEIDTLKAHFSITGNFGPSHRLMNKELAGGALLDLGIYPITFANLVFGKHPTHIKSSAVIGETGIDESSFYLFEYEKGQRAVLSSSIKDHSPTEAIICGSKGYIRVPEFLGAREIHIHLPEQTTRVINFPRAEEENFVYEIEHANKCISSNLTQSPVLPLSESLAIIETMDTLRKQWNLVYKED